MPLSKEYIEAAIQKSLTGNELTGLLSVDYTYDSAVKHFLLKFYLDHQPAELDYEQAGIISTEFASHFSDSELLSIKEECLFTGN